MEHLIINIHPITRFGISNDLLNAIVETYWSLMAIKEDKPLFDFEVKYNLDLTFSRN